MAAPSYEAVRDALPEIIALRAEITGYYRDSVARRVPVLLSREQTRRVADSLEVLQVLLEEIERRGPAAEGGA